MTNQQTPKKRKKRKNSDRAPGLFLIFYPNTVLEVHGNFEGYHALNEILVERIKKKRMLKLRLHIDKKRVTTVQADSVSAGGSY